jgi:hypothetical protein
MISIGLFIFLSTLSSRVVAERPQEEMDARIVFERVFKSVLVQIFIKR